MRRARARGAASAARDGRRRRGERGTYTHERLLGALRGLLVRLREELDERLYVPHARGKPRIGKPLA
jgi:hypothetical protein